MHCFLFGWKMGGNPFLGGKPIGGNLENSILVEKLYEPYLIFAISTEKHFHSCYFRNQTVIKFVISNLVIFSQKINISIDNCHFLSPAISIVFSALRESCNFWFNNSQICNRNLISPFISL